MDEKAYVVRVPKRWARIALIVLVTTMIVAPLTAWAADSFTDVPDSNIFHEDIEWAKDTGVTKGCNPPANTEFCPKDDVSRETMAAFMHRLADNQVVDAGELEGDPKSTFQQWGDTLPSGDSLTGTWVVAGDAGFPGDNITFSTPLPGDIPDSDSHFLDVGDPTTANCPGIGQAAPGHLCVYAVQTTGSISFFCLCDPNGGGNLVRSYGTALFMDSSSTAQFAYGSWTVTSTSGLVPLSAEKQSDSDPDSPGS